MNFLVNAFVILFLASSVANLVTAATAVLIWRKLKSTK